MPVPLDILLERLKDRMESDFYTKNMSEHLNPKLVRDRHEASVPKFLQLEWRGVERTYQSTNELLREIRWMKEASADSNNMLFNQAKEFDTGSLQFMIPAATYQILQRAQLRSPIWYGVLRAAHEGKVWGGQGSIQIKRNVWHPILGGYANEYGRELHLKRPWFMDTINYDAPGILSDLSGRFTLMAEAAFGRDERLDVTSTNVTG